jgi:hypothetical protein
MKKLDATIIAAILFATAIATTIFVMNTMTLQPVYAPPTSCVGCARDFAPGQEAENPSGAKDFAPGHCIGCEPNDVAPGELKKNQIE